MDRSASNVRFGLLNHEPIVTTESDETRCLTARELRWVPAPFVGVLCPDMARLGRNNRKESGGKLKLGGWRRESDNNPPPLAYKATSALTVAFTHAIDRGWFTDFDRLVMDSNAITFLFLYRLAATMSDTSENSEANRPLNQSRQHDPYPKVLRSS